MLKKGFTLSAVIVAATLSIIAYAGSDKKLRLKLTGKGNFTADNGKILFYRWLKQNKAAYTQRFRLEFNLKWVAGFCGPVFRPSLGKLGREMRVEESIDLAAGAVTDRGKIPNSVIGYSRTAKESMGGVLIDIKLNQDCFNREAKSAYLMWFFNGDMLKGRKLTWEKKSVTLPETIRNRSLFKDPENTVKTLRISLTDDIDLGMVFLDGFKNKAFYQFKSKKNMPEIKKADSVFELSATMKGHDARYFAILLRPGEKLPGIKDILTATRPKTKPIKKGNLINQGSSFETGPFDGFCSYNRYCHCAPFERFKPYPDPEVVNNTARDGNHSLYIKTPARAGVVFNPVKLELGKTYTLSAWMKSDKPKTGVSVIIGSKGEQIKKNFFLTKHWKRYSFSFVPKKFTYMGHCPIRFTNLKKNCSGFWIDAIQLEEGKLTNYASAGKLEMGAEIKNDFRLVKASEPSVVTLYFRNNGDKPKAGKLSYIVKDYWEKPVRSGKIAVKTVPARGNSMQKLDLGKLPRGYYRAYFTTSWGEKEEVIWGVFKPQKLVKVSPHWPFGAHEICGEDVLYRQLGFGWMGCFFGWHFLDVFSKPDMKTDFSRANKLLELADKAGINLKPIMTIGFHQKAFHQKRGWIKNWWKSDRISSVKHPRRGDNYLPDKELWEKYIYETVLQYKRKITYWEIISESNSCLVPEDYVDLLKIAYQAAKKANPDCKIVGIASTSDMGGKPLPYTRKVLELGGWQYLDVVSIHMYGNQPPEIHFGGEDNIYNMIKDICAKHGKKVQVWNTEKNSGAITSGYSEHKFNVPPIQHYHQGRRIPTFKNKGEYFIREGIITSSVGNGPFFWFPTLPNRTFISYVTFCTYMHGPNYFEVDMAPRPELIAVNGFTSLLDPNMRGSGVVDWGEFNRCSLFASYGGTVAALWNWKNKAVVEIPVKAIKFKLYNYFGEPINIRPDKSGILRVSLDGAPKYLVLPKLTPEKAKKLLAKSGFPGARQFDALAKLVWKNNTPELGVTVKSLDRSPINVELCITSLPKGWKCAVKQRKIKQIAPGKSATASIGPLSFVPLPQGGMISAQVKSKKQTEKINAQILPVKSASQIRKMLDRSGIAVAENRTSRPVKIDGFIDEWQDSPAVWITDSRGDRHWNGVKDGSCRLALGWDKNFLYFAIRVYDDRIDNTAKGNKMLWNGDSIELFFNFDFSDDKPGQEVVGYRMNKDDFHATVAPKSFDSDKAIIRWKYLASDAGTKVVSQLLSDGYIIEGAVPWKSLKSRCRFVSPQAGSRIGFSFVLNDRDGGVSVMKRLIWHGDQGVNKSPDTWGKLYFNN